MPCQELSPNTDMLSCNFSRPRAQREDVFMASCTADVRIYQAALQPSIVLLYGDVSYALLVLKAPLETKSSMASQNASLRRTESSPAVAPFGSACLGSCLTTAETWGTQIRQEQKGQREELQAHQLTGHLSRCKAKPRLSWGAFCAGISQMSRGLTVLIKHLRNLAGSPPHYPWCSRMFSGDLPLLSLLSELLSSSTSPFAHSGETLTLGPDGPDGKKLFQTLESQECSSIT